jgi:hypothetical protein
MRDLNGGLMWNGNWAWSLPLIVLSVILHVSVLAVINTRVVRMTGGLKARFRFMFVFAMVLGVTTMLAILLHILEASIWALVYWILGALPTGTSAFLYSLGAMTTYGHEPVYLADHWRLMGAFEAVNGMILFGLTTAFLYSMVREVWPNTTGSPHG